MKNTQSSSLELISQKIFIVRGCKVMLGKHIAELYQIPVKVMIQSVTRNKARFPGDFMFQLTHEEFENLKSQFVTSSWGGMRRARPYVFTEHGVAMLSSVLRSPRAVQMNIYIIRAFIQLREFMAMNRELSRKVDLLESGQKEHGKHISTITSVLRRLTRQTVHPQKRIGFKKE